MTKHMRFRSAETVTAITADYDDLKTLNEVLSRPVQYPQNKFILDYADRHGILLIPEVPAWQLTQEQMYSEEMRDLEKQQLREMNAEDFNHPAVWAWNIGNEIESNTGPGLEFVIVTTLSCIGWRITSRSCVSNSGNSSRNKTPPCAREISPGYCLFY